MAWKRWRRVPEAGACDFCLTLATRGAVYHTKITAVGKLYHRMCRCSAAVEGDLDRKNDVAIPEEDADRIVVMRVTKRGRTYQYRYDLSKFRRLDDPPGPRPPRPVGKSGVTVTDTPSPTAAGAVTPERLSSVQLQLRQLRERLPTSTERQKEWITGRIDELVAEEAKLLEALGVAPTPAPVTFADKLAAIRSKYRRDTKRGEWIGDGGPSDLARENLDVVLEAGDEVLDRVEGRLDKSVIAAKRAELEAAQERLKAAKERSNTIHASDEILDLERDLNERMAGLRMTFDEAGENREKFRQALDDKGVSRADWEIAAREVRGVQAKIRSEAYQDWSSAFDDMRAAKGEVRFAEQRAWRAAITEVLEEVRPIGGKGTTFVNPKTRKPLTSRGVLAQVLEDASQVYPTEWLEAQARTFPELKTASSKRGYFANIRSEIRISGSSSHATPKDPKGYFPTAVHELGHSMEYSLHDIGRLEWIWLRGRAKFDTDTPERRTNIYGPSEKGYRDDFTAHYTGKTYARLSTDLEGPEFAYEVFTTGVEALYGGSIDSYMMTKSGDTFDRDFARFILGVLAVV